jgi:very-short-patch-repair endonuclease
MSLTYQPDKRGRFTCAECGKTYLNWLSLAGRTRFCSHTCRILWHNHRRRVLRPTGIERALRAALLARGIDATPEYRVGRFSIDLALPERKIAIEADGAYWHRQPKQQRADVRKAAYLAAQGWTLLRFTEAEINTDARVCAALVAALL